MSVKEIINKIKLFLNEEIASTQQNFTDVKTTDGLILSYDGDLAVGIEIFVVDETGKNPAPDGEYILEDGTKISVMDGKVEEFGMEAEPVEPNPAEMPAEMPAGMPAMPGMNMSVEDTLAELVAKVKKCEEDNLALAEVVAQLAEGFSKQNFKEEVKMSMVKPVEKRTERPLNKKQNELSNIFKNMYK
jgi:hypothetical protein